MHMGNGKDYKDEYCMVNGKLFWFPHRRILLSDSVLGRLS